MPAAEDIALRETWVVILVNRRIVAISTLRHLRNHQRAYVVDIAILSAPLLVQTVGEVHDRMGTPD